MRHITHSREADHPVGMHEMGHYSTVCQNRNRHVTTFFKKQRQQKKQDAFFKWRKHRHPPYQKSSVVENLRTYITHIYYLKTWFFPPIKSIIFCTVLYEQSQLICSLLINVYEQARIISTTIWQEIVVVQNFGLEKIEPLSALINKTKILFMSPLNHFKSLYFIFQMNLFVDIYKRPSWSNLPEESYLKSITGVILTVTKYFCKTSNLFFFLSGNTDISNIKDISSEKYNWSLCLYTYKSIRL